MMNFRQSSRIGVDIGRRAIKAIELRRAGTEWRIAAAVQVPLRQPGALTTDEAIRFVEAMDRQGFSSRTVAVSAPADLLLCSVLELPPVSGLAPMEQIARGEAARVHRLAGAPFEFSYWSLPGPRGSRGASALSVTLPHKAATDIIGPLTAAGLDVVVLEGWMFAALRACFRLAAEAPKLTALIDVGWSAMRLVLSLGTTIIAVREVTEAGLDKFLPRLSEELGIDRDSIEEAFETTESLDGLPPELAKAFSEHIDLMVSEINTSFSYAQQQSTSEGVGRVLLIGAAANSPVLQQRLKEGVDALITPVSPQRMLTVAPELFQKLQQTSYTLAMGTAQHPEAA
jgi:Tfp pilus assembly PilM family ATPase